MGLLSITRPVADLYSSHWYRKSTKEIAAACEKQLGLEIDKKKMVLPEPIKACGTTIVPVKLHREVTAKLTVKVQEA